MSIELLKTKIKIYESTKQHDPDLLAADLFEMRVFNDVFEQLPKLLAVVEAAEAAIDEADPRKYGDLTPKMQELAARLKALHEGTK